MLHDRPAGESPAETSPVGPPVPGWTARPAPSRTPMEGLRVRLEPLDPARHARALFEAYSADPGGMWTYLPVGPYARFEDYLADAERDARSEDPLVFAILDRDEGRPLGQASYLRIAPASGVIEVGSIRFSPALKRTALATEAMYLMARRAFEELGYRRYEWKCDALNAPSRRAAERLGFRFEGIFRKHMIVKGRSRDTAWYAITDDEWPLVKAALQAWLDPANFDAEGRQRRSLSALREALAAGRNGP